MTHDKLTSPEIISKFPLRYEYILDHVNERYNEIFNTLRYTKKHLKKSDVSMTVKERYYCGNLPGIHYIIGFYVNLCRDMIRGLEDVIDENYLTKDKHRDIINQFQDLKNRLGVLALENWEIVSELRENIVSNY